MGHEAQRGESATALNAASVGAHPSSLARPPAYDRRAVSPGIVHLGLGAFHRAHQADYIDRLLARDPRWGICGVSMRSADAVEALSAQDGLYTLAILDREISYRLIGSVIKAMHVSNPELLTLAASEATRLLTLTVTEKGYCLTREGDLDFSHGDIAHDRQNPAAPKSAVGWIVECLRRRRANGAGPLTVMSCDNLPGNGALLRKAVTALARETDPDLAEWIEGEARFPSTMVDSITPATDDRLRAQVRRDTGYDDRWPIQREAFTSWVIENDTTTDFPDLQSVGAVVTTDVGAHEQAKLRLLNGAHSTLAYYGLALGFRTVRDAMRDAGIFALVDCLMREEIAPSIAAPDGLDLSVYRAALLDRFSNPAIEHNLSQIAWDGSKKLPVRILPTIADNLRAERPIGFLCLGVASWFRFVRRAARTGADIVDPMKETLLKLGAECSDEAERDVALFLRAGVFSAGILESDVFKEALKAGYNRLLREEAAS